MVCILTLHFAFAPDLVAESFEENTAESASAASALDAPRETEGSVRWTIPSRHVAGPLATLDVVSGVEGPIADGVLLCGEPGSADDTSCPDDVWLYAVIDTLLQCLDGGADGADIHSVNCIYLGGGMWRYRVQATCTYNIW